VDVLGDGPQIINLAEAHGFQHWRGGNAPRAFTNNLHIPSFTAEFSCPAGEWTFPLGIEGENEVLGRKGCYRFSLSVPTRGIFFPGAFTIIVGPDGWLLCLTRYLF